ncbi:MULTISPECIES: pitrilysin family protein [unclassified Micromonospora]|uniref:M16 family metallopeptidase n=1 Tax=unclassified Micromonospora TaxID=2617518 RepID=UPI00188E0F30|nr:MULTISPECIES: pitrilysin family protein [unclassified Micromonospora]MBF5029696.1 insulinase family protein [Micromonospora sp. ANENR4]MCZ7473845.1 pitrilysin family protein [Micromonospora sp. WMMC273]WBC04510.1 pitrilysin family protein [Micromonospora sp. WMMA1976]
MSSSGASTGRGVAPIGSAARAVTRTLSDDPLGGTVRRTVLPSGLRVLTEAIPAMRSVSFGIWVAVGSRDETGTQAGAAHFLEHLLFKGTNKRSALEISAQIEAVGGETNAFTTKEYTCYYARVLDEDLPLAIDVMCDLVADSVLAPADVETERGVILEEIAMHDDEPGDEVHDLFARAVYGDHPLGRLISGTEETVTPMTRRQIQSFYRRRYTAPQIVIAAAGNLDHAAVVKLVRQALRGTPLDTDPASPAPHRSATPAVRTKPATTLVEPKETEQAHVILGCPGIDRTDDRRFALGVLNNVLGGGMSSRLFQEIREQRGLAYSVYSYASQYADSGVFAVYAGCAPGKVDEVLDLTRAGLARVAAEGITEAELARGKGMSKGSFVLGLEDTGSRMSRLAKGELLYGNLMPVDDLLSRVDAVTLDDVNALAADLLGRPMSLAVVGPFDSGSFAVTS